MTQLSSCAPTLSTLLPLLSLNLWLNACGGDEPAETDTTTATQTTASDPTLPATSTQTSATNGVDASSVGASSVGAGGAASAQASSNTSGSTTAGGNTSGAGGALGSTSTSSAASTSTGASSSAGGANNTASASSSSASVATGAGGSGQASDTWTSFAQAFFQDYCVTCHNADNAGDASRDYTELSSVTTEADAIACGVASVATRATLNCANDAPVAEQFPLVGTPSQAERDRLVAWIQAGMPE